MNEQSEEIVNLVQGLAKACRAKGVAALEVTLGPCTVKMNLLPPEMSGNLQPHVSYKPPTAFEAQQLRFYQRKQDMEMMYAHTGGTVTDEEVWQALGEERLKPQAGERADEEATAKAPGEADEEATETAHG